MDYKKFLSHKQSMALPYFGGARVDAPNRRLRLRGSAEPGWWSFEVEGRYAKPLKRTDPADLSACPLVRGHYAVGWLFSSGAELGRIALSPDDEPEPLAPCVGRRWYGGELLLESVEFEDEAEDLARQALQDGLSIAEVKGVTPGLRAAFGFALATAAGRAASVPLSPREVQSHVHDIANGGRSVADTVVSHIRTEREQWAALVAAERHENTLRETAATARVLNVRRLPRSPEERAEQALDGAGARLLGCRTLSGGDIEVTFRFMDERFISIADAATLQVYDSGICLEGTDRRLTLDSLPSAIKEAIDTDQLYITRR